MFSPNAHQPKDSLNPSNSDGNDDIVINVSDIAKKASNFLPQSEFKLRERDSNQKVKSSEEKPRRKMYLSV